MENELTKKVINNEYNFVRFFCKEIIKDNYIRFYDDKIRDMYDNNFTDLYGEMTPEIFTEIKKIKEVGIVDNDGSQVGLVEIQKKDNGDYRIKALRDFESVELAIVLADAVVVVKLLDGVAPTEPVVEEPAAPQVEEAQPISSAAALLQPYQETSPLCI